jgi:putative acetyltransferase
MWRQGSTSRSDASIREEEPADVDAIQSVNEAAFGRPDEARLVARLRAQGGVLLSLVAVVNGRVVGHILFTPVSIGTAPDGPRGAGLGPMTVRPEWQRRGVGSKLVIEGRHRLRERGCPFIVVLGHPEYYPRLGFGVASRHGLRSEWDVPDAAFMVLPLQPAPLTPGVVMYRDEFTAVT